MNLHPIRWKWMRIAAEWIRFTWGFPAFWERADDVTSDRYAETSRDVFKLAKHFLFQQFECVVEVESTQVRVNPISNSNQVNQTMQKSSELFRRALMHSLSLRNWIKVDVIRVAVGDWFRFLQSSFQLEDLHSILAGILRDSLGILGGYSGLIQPDSPPPYGILREILMGLGGRRSVAALADSDLQLFEGFQLRFFSVSLGLCFGILGIIPRQIEGLTAMKSSASKLFVHRTDPKLPKSMVGFYFG